MLTLDFRPVSFPRTSIGADGRWGWLWWGLYIEWIGHGDKFDSALQCRAHVGIWTGCNEAIHDCPVAVLLFKLEAGGGDGAGGEENEVLGLYAAEEGEAVLRLEPVIEGGDELLWGCGGEEELVGVGDEVGGGDDVAAEHEGHCE